MKVQNLLIAGIAIAIGVWAYKKYGKKDDVSTPDSTPKTSNCCGA